jgi:hypothetical protein
MKLVHSGILANVQKLTVLEEKALSCSVCWCKHFHHGQYEATRVTKPNVDLGKDVHLWLSSANWTWHCRVVLRLGERIVVWILNVSQRLSVGGLVPSLWCCWQMMEPLGMGSRGKKLGYWKCALEGNSGTLVPSSFSFCFWATLRWVTLVYYMLSTIMHCFTTMEPTNHGPTPFLLGKSCLS